MSRIRLVVLGSTGSIGRQTLDVARRYPDRIEVVGLAARSNVELLLAQAAEFEVQDLALEDAASAERASSACGRPVASGRQAIQLMAASGADVVLNALVGAAGLRASEAALSAGSMLALANKESLVAGGEVLTRLGLDRILPVDSEHSAIFQCLIGEPAPNRIWLTASGGPFRGATPERLRLVAVSEALAHPRWTMGPKITIDSATLMNKGLEVIEAHHLFGVSYDQITVVVHPESCVHSMVEFADGSVKAHLGATDMRVPIQYALSHPERWDAPATPVDFLTLGALHFEAPDTRTFRCLALAYDAGREGGTLPAVMNAANEIAVASFLAGQSSFDAIPRVVESVMQSHSNSAADTLEAIEAADGWARTEAARLLA